MKKLLALVAAGALAGCLALFGCSSGVDEPGTVPDAPPVTEMPEDALTGGWTVNEEFNSKSVSEEQLALFNDAAAKVLDVSYEPIAVLGTQVVAGTNYAFLCQSIYWEGDAKPVWSVVTVYNNLEGNSSITDDKTIEIMDVKTTDVTASAEATGAWAVPDPNGNMVVPEQAQAAFDNAMATYDGVKASPIALLGTQVVAGTNYRYLAEGASAAETPVNTLYVVEVYEDIDGACLVTDMKPFDLLYYVTPNGVE